MPSIHSLQLNKLSIRLHKLNRPLMPHKQQQKYIRSSLSWLKIRDIKYKILFLKRYYRHEEFDKKTCHDEN